MGSRKKYTMRAFFFDAFMTCCTSGLWLIRVYVREKRR